MEQTQKKRKIGGIEMSELRMRPQPPEGTAKVKQIGRTDNFDCLELGTNAMLAVVRRPLNSTVRPVCENNVWYWRK
jgi:hypothetical protein